MLSLELKRVLRLRSTIIVALISLFCACASPFLSTIGVNSYKTDERGNYQALFGYSGVKLRRESEAVYNGPVTPELLWQVTDSYQTLCAEYGSNNIPNEIFIKQIFPAEPLMLLLHAQYSDPGMYGYEGLLSLSQQDVADFYRLRDEAVEDYLTVQLGEDSAAYQLARKKAEQVQTPFAFYAHPGWPNACGNISTLAIIAMLAGCVISAQMFSAEYQSGAYMILRAAKNGRERLARVKVLSALIVSGSLYLAMLLIYSVLCIFIFGAEGLSAPIQFASLLSPMPFTFKDTYMLSACMGLVTVLAMSAFAVLLSSRFVSSMFPVVICFSLLALQQFLGSIPAAWANFLGDLLPSSGSAMYGELFRINYFEAGSVAVWSPYVILFANMITVPLCGTLAIHSYCSYNAKSKGV